MSDKRTFKCDYCDDPCILIMYGMDEKDDDDVEVKPIACPYDGTIVDYWKEVDE